MNALQHDDRQYHQLTELIEPGTSRASSLLFAQDGRFLLGVRPPLDERRYVLLRLTGIGGWAQGEESFAEAARREALEETGSEVRLFDRAETLIVRSPEDIARLSFSGEPAPVAIVFRRFGTAPLDPWAEGYSHIAPVAIFAGGLRRPPRINAPHEHPFFMWVYPEQMIELVDSDEPLQYLLDDGAELCGAFDGDPDRALVRLTDSIQALLAALGTRGSALLNDIMRLTQTARAQ